MTIMIDEDILKCSQPDPIPPPPKKIIILMSKCQKEMGRLTTFQQILLSDLFIIISVIGVELFQGRIQRQCG